MCCSGHQCLQGVVGGHAGWRKGETLVTGARVACAVCSLSPFLAGEGDGEGAGLHREMLKGNC